MTRKGWDSHQVPGFLVQCCSGPVAPARTWPHLPPLLTVLGGHCRPGAPSEWCGAGLAHLPSEGPAPGPRGGLHPGLPGALWLRPGAGDQRHPGGAAGPCPQPAGPRPRQVGRPWEEAPGRPPAQGLARSALQALSGPCLGASASHSSLVSQDPACSLPQSGVSRPFKLMSPRRFSQAPVGQSAQLDSLPHLVGKGLDMGWERGC